jgi:type IV secretory pathway VirJ component
MRAALIGAALFASVAVTAAAGSAEQAPPGDSVGSLAYAAPDHVSHGRFLNVSIYAPTGTPTSFVLLLSGAGGWNAGVAELAQRLAQHGAMVAGIDLPKLVADFEADAGDCVFPDGDLENLSHFLQAYYHLPTYLPPFLVGYGSGASLAYATLVQAPPGTFAGALTLGFCPTTNLRKPLCKGSGIESVPRAGGGGVSFLPTRQLQSPWVALQGGRDPICGAPEIKEFVTNMSGAALVALPQVGADLAPSSRWMPQFLAAFQTLVSRNASRLAPPAPAALGDLPVVEIPAQSGKAPTDSFALILSGDGGWAGLDKEVAQALSAHGIPVVGLDSLRYFWSARTPAGLAADIDRLIRYYLEHLDKQRVLLIGYSQGADVLPFAVNRLPPATRSRIALAVLMGMSEHALFEFHVSSWISDDNSGPATMPEVNRIADIPVLCIYGEGDNDSLCPDLDPAKVRIVKLPGGHHFNGDYAKLALEILASASR